jgi:hypothetical protein
MPVPSCTHANRSILQELATGFRREERRSDVVGPADAWYQKQQVTYPRKDGALE